MGWRKFNYIRRHSIANIRILILFMEQSNPTIACWNNTKMRAMVLLELTLNKFTAAVMWQNVGKLCVFFCVIACGRKSQWSVAKFLDFLHFYYHICKKKNNFEKRDGASVSTNLCEVRSKSRLPYCEQMTYDEMIFLVNVKLIFKNLWEFNCISIV